MEIDESADLIFSAVRAERKAILNRTIKPISTAPAHQIELEKVLEEMARIIEADGGILTP